MVLEAENLSFSFSLEGEEILLGDKFMAATGRNNIHQHFKDIMFTMIYILGNN